HQAKKLDEDQLRAFRDRFDLPISDEDIKRQPFLRLDPDSPEHRYLMERRRELGGFVPERVVAVEPMPAPDFALFEEFLARSGDRPVSTTMIAVSLPPQPVRDEP